jgi:hypothetical protein
MATHLGIWAGRLTLRYRWHMPSALDVPVLQDSFVAPAPGSLATAPGTALSLETCPAGLRGVPE